MIYVSPAEPSALRGDWTVSSDCELNGVDFMWDSRMGWVGIQRKEVKDLLASIKDGRLTREVAQMARLDMSALIIEGPMRWQPNGTLTVGRFGAMWTKKQQAGLEFSLQSQGIWILRSISISDTLKMVKWLYEWTSKEGHTFMRVRPKPVGAWGTATNEDYQLHLLQGFSGVGPGTAQRILDRFGKVPLKWDCTAAELLEVEGIGAKRVQSLFAALSRKLCECGPRDQVRDGDNPTRCYRCSGEIDV